METYMEKTFGMMQHLDIAICTDVDDAISKGYIYHNGEKALEIKKVIVVGGGTVAGNKTVDIISEDAYGNKFITMITGNLLKSLLQLL